MYGIHSDLILIDRNTEEKRFNSFIWYSALRYLSEFKVTPKKTVIYLLTNQLPLNIGKPDINAFFLDP